MLIDKLLEQDRFRKMNKNGIFLKDAEIIKISSNVIDEKDFQEISKYLNLFLSKIKSVAKSDKLEQYLDFFDKNNPDDFQAEEREKFLEDFHKTLIEVAKLYKEQGVIEHSFPFQRAKFPFDNLVLEHDLFMIWICNGEVLETATESKQRQKKNATKKKSITKHEENMNKFVDELRNIEGDTDLYYITIFHFDVETANVLEQHGYFLQNRENFTIPIGYIQLKEKYSGGILKWDYLQNRLEDAVDNKEVLQFQLYNYIAIKVAALCNCKNIELKKEHNAVPSKVKQRRIKENKLPLKSCYTIWIKQSRGKANTEKLGQWTNRVHIARGHFKDYTAEKPLFGKHVGSWWWQPWIRGDKNKGIIIKDYTMDRDKL